ARVNMGGSSLVVLVGPVRPPVLRVIQAVVVQPVSEVEVVLHLSLGLGVGLAVADGDCMDVVAEALLRGANPCSEASLAHGELRLGVYRAQVEGATSGVGVRRSCHPSGVVAALVYCERLAVDGLGSLEQSPGAVVHQRTVVAQSGVVAGRGG